MNYIIQTPSARRLKEEILKGDVHTIDEMKGMAAAFGLQQY